MPIFKVEVNEYLCVHCGYIWTNRVNGKDGPVPKRCAKCKRTNWDKGSISPKEVGLRRRIKGFNELYSYKYDEKMSSLIKWNPDVCEKFLNMDPRPTVEQLKRVVYSSPLRRYNNGSDVYRYRGWIPDPDKPGYLKYDKSPWIQDPNNPGKTIYNPDRNFVSDYNKLIVEEAQTRRKLMEDTLRARGINVVDLFIEYTALKSSKTYKELLEEMAGNNKTV
jgi:hypothetical protein